VTAAGELLGLLAEDERLRVFAALTLGATASAEVRERTGLSLKSVMRALARLEAGGLVSADGDEWRAHPEVLKQAAREAAPVAEPEDFGTSDANAERVLRTFLRDGRITQIPTAHAKRLVVLDHVARVFEPGVRYAEREVNAALRAFHPDYAALRRYLVDAGLLGRERNVYWRTGGSFDVDHS
jgi:hypothetical protein